MFERAYHEIHSNENMGVAILEGKLDDVKRELDNGANINHTPHDAPFVMVAAIYKHWPVVDFFLDEGAEVNMRNRFNLRLLNILAKDAPKELIEKAISMGAIINTRDNDEETPFLVAVKNNRHDVVDYLLDIHGVDITSKDKHGKNTLHYCAELGHKDMFMKLWYEGVDISTQDNSGKTPSEYIQDPDWLAELPEFEKTIIEKEKEEVVKPTEETPEEEKEVVKSTLRATGISSIQRKPKKS